MRTFQSLIPSDLPPNESYSTLTNLIVPRPIALVSSMSKGGIRNLAPFSYFNMGGSSPLSVVFSVAGQAEGGEKDTLQNIRGTGEYVINLVVRIMTQKMNVTSVNFSPEVDEWNQSGFTPIPSQIVKPERVAESPVHFECKLYEIVKHGSGSGSANYVIGEVIAIHLDEQIFNNGQEPFSPVSRLGGADYLDLETLQKFNLPRPK